MTGGVALERWQGRERAQFTAPIMEESETSTGQGTLSVPPRRSVRGPLPKRAVAKRASTPARDDTRTGAQWEPNRRTA
jgi:hypothetical protein